MSQKNDHLRSETLNYKSYWTRWRFVCNN